MSLLRYAPFLLLGPITGPLAAAATFYALRGRWWLASLYGAMIGAFWGVYPLVMSWALWFIFHRR